MTLRRALYDVVADGGAIGSYPMRGTWAVNGGILLRFQIVLLEDFFPLGGGGIITIGWTADPSALISRNPDLFPPAPSCVGGYGESAGNPVHFDPTEPFLITVSGAAFTAGSLEMFIEMPES
jgi:hypothetical protein